MAQNFKGVVINSADSSVIPYATIYIPELQTGTITDSLGKFELTHLPNKQMDIQISFIGFVTIRQTIDFSEIKTLKFYIEETHLNLHEVVISVPTGKLQDENIIDVERKKIEDLNPSSSTTLSEAISNIAGVEQSTTGSGIGKPIIRGLSGNRIVSYAQSIRMENQQWGSEHGLGVGNVGIESVEVIKGPASLLYGSDALGGVLYFVDERYAKHNTIQGFLQTKYLSNSLGTYNSGGLKLHKGKFKANMFANYVSNTDYQIPNSDRVYNSRFDEKNIKTSIGYNTKNWVSNLRYSNLNNNFGITDADSVFSNSIHRDVHSPYQNIQNHNLSWENSLYVKKSKINLVLGYILNQRKEYEEHHDHDPSGVDDHDVEDFPSLDMDLETFSYSLRWNSALLKNKFKVISGLQGMHQTNTNAGEELLIPDATTNDFGAFTLVNYSKNKLRLQTGLRLDNRVITSVPFASPEVVFALYDNSFTNFNYSFGGSYKLNKSTLRANLSSGFRAPNTSELLSDGEHHGSNQYIKGKSSLVSENATQIDFTYRYKGEHFDFAVNPFYNHINNFIYLNPIDSLIDSIRVFEYTQVDAALFGGEIGVHYHPHKIHWLHLESNLSTVFAKDENNNNLALIPTTRINTTAKVEFTNKKKALMIKEAFIQNTYKFAQNKVSANETITPAYTLLNIGLNGEIKLKKTQLDFSTGIKNVLNTKYLDHLSNLKSLTAPNQGINFYASLKWNFSSKLKD